MIGIPSHSAAGVPMGMGRPAASGVAVVAGVDEGLEVAVWVMVGEGVGEAETVTVTVIVGDGRGVMAGCGVSTRHEVSISIKGIVINSVMLAFLFMYCS